MSSGSASQRLAGSGSARERGWHFARFVFVAGLSVPVNLGARVLLSTLVPYEIAIVLSHLVGMATAFALTRRFVFGPSGRPVHGELLRFGLVNALSLSVTWVVSVGLVRLVFPVIGYELAPYFTAHLAGLAASSLSSYWGHRRFSFARA